MHLKKLKVLQFGSSNALLGAERWILALVRYCDASQVENLVITIKDSPNARIDLIDKANEMGFKTDLITAYGPFDPRTIYQTVKLIKKHKVDILHTHGYKSDIIGFLAAKLTGIPIVSTPHGFELPINPKSNMYHKLGTLFLRWLDWVVPVSEGLKDQCMEKGIHAKKIKVIKNGVDILEVQEVMPHAELLTMKREKEVKLIGYVGQLIERKGLPNLIIAMKTVTCKTKAKLLIIGDGKIKNKLQEMAGHNGLSECIDFLGFRTDRLEIVKCLDAFVLPSYLEGLPRAIMEAMAAKVPVIASDIPGIREIVHHNKTGILVPVDSPDQLADNILELINNSQKADELRQNAFNHVKLHHSAERMAKEYCRLYESIIDRTH